MWFVLIVGLLVIIIFFKLHSRNYIFIFLSNCKYINVCTVKKYFSFGFVRIIVFYLCLKIFFSNNDSAKYIFKALDYNQYAFLSTLIKQVKLLVLERRWMIYNSKGKKRGSFTSDKVSYSYCAKFCLIDLLCHGDRTVGFSYKSNNLG